MDGRAQNSRRLQSINPQRVYRASELCQWLSLPDEFHRSLTAFLKRWLLTPSPTCFFDGSGELWCRVSTVTLHLARQARGEA